MEHATEYASIEALIEGRQGENIHIECNNAGTERALAAVRRVYANRRCAFCLASDKGYERETVRSYLRLFSRIAGGAITPEEAIAHFNLKSVARTKIRALSAEQRALLNFARMSLSEPEVCFCEHPLADLGSDARNLIMQWMGTQSDAGTIFITPGQPLRDAFVMPGRAWWDDEGRMVAAAADTAESSEEATREADETEPAFAGDEVRVCKIPAKAHDATLLFDPREIDFVESVNRTNFVSVRGALYQTSLTLEELEGELSGFGFFRCHRSYIVNVQRVAKVERYTRNSFNLTLNNPEHTSIPLAKGRADQMRERYGWK